MRLVQSLVFETSSQNIVHELHEAVCYIGRSPFILKMNHFMIKKWKWFVTLYLSFLCCRVVYLSCPLVSCVVCCLGFKKTRLCSRECYVAFFITIDVEPNLKKPNCYFPHVSNAFCGLLKSWFMFLPFTVPRFCPRTAD